MKKLIDLEKLKQLQEQR